MSRHDSRMLIFRVFGVFWQFTFCFAILSTAGCTAPVANADSPDTPLVGTPAWCRDLRFATTSLRALPDTRNMLRFADGKEREGYCIGADTAANRVYSFIAPAGNDPPQIVATDMQSTVVSIIYDVQSVGAYAWRATVPHSQSPNGILVMLSEVVKSDDAKGMSKYDFAVKPW